MLRAKMDEWIETFRSAKPAEGCDRVLIPGDPEREYEEKTKREGIDLVPAIREDLVIIAKELSVDFD
jgi:L-2-hydroxycarboxylate dehydrogenase (NAD+)